MHSGTHWCFRAHLLACTRRLCQTLWTPFRTSLWVSLHSSKLLLPHSRILSFSLWLLLLHFLHMTYPSRWASINLLLDESLLCDFCCPVEAAERYWCGSAVWNKIPTKNSVYLCLCRRCGWPIWLSSVTVTPAADEQAMASVSLEEAIDFLFRRRFWPVLFCHTLGALPLFSCFILKNANKPFKN